MDFSIGTWICYAYPEMSVFHAQKCSFCVCVRPNPSEREIFEFFGNVFTTA